LANASLDIAFHDRLKKDPDYIKKFWVGLMDGDGSIQVNHWRKKNLQYRLVIQLKFNSANENMLNLIKENIGGKVRILKKEFIIWVIDNRITIINIIKIFDLFPPLTSRLRAQLFFMKKCLQHQNINLYFDERKNKYATNIFLNNSNVSSYYNEWLSGFIEAEGCFCLRQKNNHSFSIGLKNDYFILDNIKTHFYIQTKIRNTKGNVWILETYRISTLINIINHCIHYPLLGDKRTSFIKFINKIF
jgi:hypothetical protein